MFSKSNKNLNSKYMREKYFLTVNIFRFMVGNVKGDDSVETMIESTSKFTCITSKCTLTTEESKDLVYKV